MALRAKNKLTARKLLGGGFSKDGAQVYGIVRNTTGEGVAGFSLHPDGNRFLASIAKWPFDIWKLEGFDQMSRKTWPDRLFAEPRLHAEPRVW